jgi:hypothetical protein
MPDRNDPRTEVPPEFERYLAVCKRMFDRMTETGKWPWADNPNFGDESNDT